MLKLRNHNIILPKYLEIVKKKGSSFAFSASGGRDKEKKEKPAEKIAVGSEGAAEGGRGGNSAAPERKLSKVSVRIFAEKSSDFVQDRQPICKVYVSRLARGFAPRFGKRIFKQFPNEPIFFPPKAGRKAAIFCPKAIINLIK
jgi:hypothetical protein